MVNYACAFSQSELWKYFEWIIIVVKGVCMKYLWKLYYITWMKRVYFSFLYVWLVIIAGMANTKTMISVVVDGRKELGILPRSYGKVPKSWELAERKPRTEKWRLWLADIDLQATYSTTWQITFSTWATKHKFKHTERLLCIAFKNQRLSLKKSVRVKWIP